MPSFELDFSGLCGFVPKVSLDDDQGGTDNRMSVLLVDAMGHGSEPMEEHHEPVLLLPKDQVDRSGSYRRGWEVSLKNVGTFLCFPLARQELLIGENAEDWNGENLKIDVHQRQDDCPGSEDNRSFRWVASMGEIYRSAGVAKKDFVMPGGHPQLGGRVLLNRGNLCTGSFSGPRNGGPSKWGFESEQRGSANTYRALAESVLYSLGFADGTESLVLTTRHMALGSTEKIRIVFESSDVKGRIRNMPWLDILEERQGIPAVDHHFSHFYDLAERPPRLSYRRLPYRMGPCGTDRGLNTMSVTDPKCPPAQFEADPDV